MHTKDTEELLSEIRDKQNIKQFLADNQAEFRRPLAEYLTELLKEKRLNKTEVVRNSGINPNYAYHIFSGESTNPSRPKLLALAIAMRLNYDEIQYLLKYAGLSPLYPRNPWDSIIIAAIEQKLTVWETDNLLNQMGENVYLGGRF